MKRALIVSLSLFQLIAAVVIYRFLNSGGWLTHRYDLSDPNSLNLVPVIFEPIAVLTVLFYWIRRTPLLYRLLVITAIGQLLIVSAYVALLVGFALTYHPRMM